MIWLSNFMMTAIAIELNIIVLIKFYKSKDKSLNMKFYVQKIHLLLILAIFRALINIFKSLFLHLFIYFISIFILLTCKKAMKTLIHRVGNYPDLLLEIPRY